MHGRDHKLWAKKKGAPHLGLEPRTSRLEVLRSIQLSQQGWLPNGNFVMIYQTLDNIKAKYRHRPLKSYSVAFLFACTSATWVTWSVSKSGGCVSMLLADKWKQRRHWTSLKKTTVISLQTRLTLARTSSLASEAPWRNI